MNGRIPECRLCGRHPALHDVLLNGVSTVQPYLHVCAECVDIATKMDPWHEKGSGI